MWGNLNLWSNFRFLLVADVEKSDIRHVCDVENVKCMLFCCKIGFVAIYTLLSQDLFSRNLRTFVWRKIEPKIASVEKK